jgi:hypothetical protein
VLWLGLYNVGGRRSALERRRIACAGSGTRRGRSPRRACRPSRCRTCQRSGVDPRRRRQLQRDVRDLPPEPGRAGDRAQRRVVSAAAALGRTGPRSTRARAFWVLKHGIKASGMPAWGKSMDDKLPVGHGRVHAAVPDHDGGPVQRAGGGQRRATATAAARPMSGAATRTPATRKPSSPSARPSSPSTIRWPRRPTTNTTTATSTESLGRSRTSHHPLENP